MSLSDLGIAFDATGIGTVLSLHRLRVPENQRSYAWHQEHVHQLFDDLSAAFDKQPSPYFLGTIVLTASTEDRWEVADGQQRLATTSILIAAIRDYLYSAGANGRRTAIKYTGDYLLEYDEFKNDSVPKLILNIDDNEFFLRAILSEPESSDRISTSAQAASKSNALLANASQQAADFVRRLVSRYSDVEGIKHLFNWKQFLEKKVVLIVIKTPREIDAYKMFETLNDRGLKASQIDILKNFLFSEGKARISELSARWSSMVAKVESHDEDLVLGYVRHYWISKEGPTRAPDLAESFRKKINGERDAMIRVCELDETANDYVALLQALEHPRFAGYGQDVRASVHTVAVLLGIEQIRPLMLAVLRSFDKAEATLAFAKFVSWSVRFLIAGGGGGGVLDRHYGLRAQEVSAGTVRTARELSAKMVDYVPNDIDFRSAFERTTVSRKNLARYYLRCLENQRQGRSSPYIGEFERPQTTSNLEHVMPESAAKHWGVSQDEVAAYLRRIGNMCILNSKMNELAGSKRFADKLEIYRKSPFLTTQDLGEYQEWGIPQIEARQIELAKLAPIVWRI